MCRLNLVESQLWNEDNWRGKYIGVVPRRGKDDKVPFANWSLCVWGGGGGGGGGADTVINDH